MPTKDELLAENAELKAQIEELTGSLASDGVADAAIQKVAESVIAMVGRDAWNEAVDLVSEEAGDDITADVMELGEGDDAYEIKFVDGLDGQEELDAVLHVLLRPHTTSDGLEPVSVSNDAADVIDSLKRRIAEQDADIQRLTVERDDARHKGQVSRANAGTLHGSIDDLQQGR